ncbi:hypothetical protein V6N13_124830 [Hibiscus sabdariffa]
MQFQTKDPESAKAVIRVPAKIPAEAGLLALGFFSINMNIKSNQGRKLRRLRDKPVTQQDALPNSEVFLAEMFIDARPVVSTEASPLSSCKGRLSRHIHRQD